MTDREDAYSKDNPTTTHTHTTDSSVSPAEFEQFMVWACKDLCLAFAPAIKKSYSDGCLASTSSRRLGMLKPNKETEQSETKESTWKLSEILEMHPTPLVYLNSIYDNNDHLVQIKIIRNKKIPCQLIKLLALAIPFHIHLTAIHINRGLNNDGVYQLSKLLMKSNITEIVLDDTVVLEANYYLLLENNSRLKYLSLARCSLNDMAVKEIASRLHFPSTISEHLAILNLTSNKITDDGAKYLGEMLRTNRKLSYLNLAGNSITRTGADYILNSLMTFKLTKQEIFARHQRNFNFFKEKLNLQIMDEIEKKRKSVIDKSKTGLKATTANKKVKEVVNDADVTNNDEKSIKCGLIRDPFTSNDVTITDGVVYCYGNNTLSYLNLAYNNLNYFGVKKLYDVLVQQRQNDRNPRGLVNVCIDGNDIPVTCMELKEINAIIENTLSTKHVSDRKKQTLRKK